METIPLTFTVTNTQKILDATHDPKINGLMGAVDSPIYLMFSWLSKNASKNEFVDGKLTLSIPYKLAADFLSSLLILGAIAPKYGFRQMAFEANSYCAGLVQEQIQHLLGQIDMVRDESHRWN
jgi:hypothetical protein